MSGCPGYDWTGQTTPNLATTQSITMTVPKQPIINSTPVRWIEIKDANGNLPNPLILGAVGLAVNGVKVYGNSNATGQDAFLTESRTFDHCGGHNVSFPRFACVCEYLQACAQMEVL